MWEDSTAHPLQKDGTGLLLYKFSQDYTTATSVGAVDIWPAMRLAEVLFELCGSY